MEEKKIDIDYAETPVPRESRRGLLTMFMIMLGFTFFSASMWVGQELADGLNLGGFIWSLILGGVILGLYTGLLGRDTEPTDNEIKEWVNLLNKGTSRAEVFKQLANTQEFTNYCNKMHVTTGTINPASYSMG